MGKKLIALEYHAELLPHPGERILLEAADYFAVQCDLAALYFFQPVDAAEQGRLSAPRGTEYHDHLTPAQIEIHALQDFGVPKVFSEPAYAELYVPFYFFHSVAFLSSCVQTAQRCSK